MIENQFPRMSDVQHLPECRAKLTMSVDVGRSGPRAWRHRGPEM